MVTPIVPNPGEDVDHYRMKPVYHMEKGDKQFTDPQGPVPMATEAPDAPSYFPLTPGGDPVETQPSFFGEDKFNAIPATELAYEKAGRYDFALGKQSPGEDTLFNEIVAGGEEDGRRRASLDERLNLNQKRSQLAQLYLSNLKPGEVTAEQVNEFYNLDREQVDLALSDPATFYERKFARQAMDIRMSDQTATDEPQPNNTIRQTINKVGDDIITKQQLARSLFEYAQTITKERTWGDVGLSLIPFYTYNALTSVIKDDPGFLQGEKLKNQISNAYQMNPSEFMDKNKKYIEQLNETDPDLALQYASALLGFTSTEEFFNNAASMLDLSTFTPGTIVAGALGVKALGRSAIHAPGQYINNLKMLQATGSMKGMVKNMAGTTIDYTAILPEARKAHQAAVNSLRAKAARTGQTADWKDMEGVIQDVINPSKVMSGGVNMTAEEAARLEVALLRSSANSLDQLVNRPRVLNRLSVDEASVARSEAEQFVDRMYTNTTVGSRVVKIAGANSYIPAEATLGNTDMISFHIGTKSLTGYATEGGAKGAAKKLGLSKFDVEEVNGTHYVRVTIPVDEASTLMRAFRDTSDKFADKPHNMMIHGVMSRLRMRDSLIPEQLSEDFKVAQASTNTYFEANRAQFVRDFDGLGKKSRADLDTYLSMERDYRKQTGPTHANDIVRGKYTRTVGELQQNWMKMFGRNPTANEMKAYFSWKNWNDIDYAVRNLDLTRDMNRLGIRNIQLRTRPSGSTESAWSPNLEGKIHLEFPWDRQGDAGILIWDAADPANSVRLRKSYVKNEGGPITGKNQNYYGRDRIDSMIRDDGYRVIHLSPYAKANLSDFMKSLGPTPVDNPIPTGPIGTTPQGPITYALKPGEVYGPKPMDSLTKYLTDTYGGGSYKKYQEHLEGLFQKARERAATKTSANVPEVKLELNKDVPGTNTKIVSGTASDGTVFLQRKTTVDGKVTSREILYEDGWRKLGLKTKVDTQGLKKYSEETLELNRVANREMRAIYDAANEPVETLTEETVSLTSKELMDAKKSIKVIDPDITVNYSKGLFTLRKGDDKLLEKGTLEDVVNYFEKQKTTKGPQEVDTFGPWKVGGQVDVLDADGAIVKISDEPIVIQKLWTDPNAPKDTNLGKNRPQSGVFAQTNQGFFPVERLGYRDEVVETAASKDPMVVDARYNREPAKVTPLREFGPEDTVPTKTPETPEPWTPGRYDYLIVKAEQDFKESSLDFVRFPYQEGGHKLDADSYFFIRQSQIYTHKQAQSVVNTYEGDVNAYSAVLESDAKAMNDRLNVMRDLLANGKDRDAELYYVKYLDGTSKSYKEFKNQFKEINDTGHLSLKHPFVVTPRNKSTWDYIRPEIKDNKGNLMYPNLENARDSEHNLFHNELNLEFALQRSDNLERVMRKGTADYPVFGTEIPSNLSPMATLINTTSDMIRGRVIDDLKIKSAENFAKAYARVVDAAPELVRRDPMEYILNPQWKKGLQGSDLMLLNQAKDYRRALVDFLGVENPTRDFFTSVQRTVADELKDKLGPKSFDWVDRHLMRGKHIDPIRWANNMTFDLFFGMMNIKQLAVQAMTSFHPIAVVGPQIGLQAGFAAHLARWVLYQNNPARELLLAKALKSIGIKEDHFLEGLKAYRDSGWHVIGAETAMQDDFINQSIKEGWLENARNYGRVLFREGDRFARGTGFFSAYLEWRLANPAAKLTQRKLGELVNRADTLTLNMTAASNSSIATGVGAIPLKFTTYYARLMEQLLPGWTSSKLTAGERMRAYATYSAMFGVPITAGGVVGVWPLHKEWTKELIDRGYETDENLVLKAFNEGLAGLIPGLVGIDQNFSEALGPTGTSWMYDIYHGKSPLFDVVTGVGGTKLEETFENTWPFFTFIANVFRDDDEKYPLSIADLEPLVRSFSSVNNVWKSIEMYNLGNYMSKNGTPLSRDVGATDSIMNLMFGTQPRELSEAFLKGDMVRTTDAMKKEARREILKYHRLYLKAIINDDLDQAEEYGKIIKFHTVKSGFMPNELNSLFSDSISESGDYVNHAEEKFNNSTPERKKMYLDRIRKTPINGQ